MPFTFRKAFGFTLVELLVIIAIIAILAVLLVPVGMGMIARGHTAKCASNVKQISVALNQAIAEDNLRVPFSSASPEESHSGGWEFWFATISP